MAGLPPAFHCFGAAESHWRNIGFPLFVGSRQLPFELSHDLSRSIFVQSLAMPVLKTFDAGQTLAFQGSREHDRRTIADSVGGFKRCKEIGNIVSINDQRLPAECFPASLVDFQIGTAASLAGSDPAG